MIMLARYDALNNEALQRLLQGGVQLRAYSNEILAAAEKASFELFDELAAKNADFKSIFAGWKQFRDRVFAWTNINESSFARYSYSKLKS